MNCGVLALLTFPGVFTESRKLLILEPWEGLIYPHIAKAPENPHIPHVLSRLQRGISDFPSFKPVRKCSGLSIQTCHLSCNLLLPERHFLAFVFIRRGWAES